MKYLILILFFIGCKEKKDGSLFTKEEDATFRKLFIVPQKEQTGTIITITQPSKILINKTFMLPDSELIIKYQLDGFIGSKTGVFKNVLAGNHVITMCLDDRFSGDNLTNFAKSLVSLTFTNKKPSTVQATGIYKKNEKPILSVSY